MSSLRWGVGSTADSGMRKVIPAIPRAEHSEVVASASCSRDRTAAAARPGANVKVVEAILAT